MTSGRCFHTSSNFKTLPMPKNSPSHWQLLRIWRPNNNTNTAVQTMDKAAISILHIRLDKDIQTASHGKQTLLKQDHSLITRDIVQFTPCLPIHGETVTTIRRIRPWEASIIIPKVMHIITKEAIESTSLEALSTVTNTDNLNKSNEQTYVLKHLKINPIEVRKIAQS